MEIDVARYSVLSRVHGCRDGACVNATPATCRGKRPSKGGDVDERWKIFFGFSPLNFYSNPIVCLTPYVVTLIGLRCLFWRQRHNDVMLRGNRKFLPTTIWRPAANMYWFTTAYLSTGHIGPCCYTILRALWRTLARPIRGARLAQLFLKPMLHLGKRKFYRSVGWPFAPNIPNGPPSIFYFFRGWLSLTLRPKRWSRKWT